MPADLCITGCMHSVKVENVLNDITREDTCMKTVLWANTEQVETSGVISQL